MTVELSARHLRNLLRSAENTGVAAVLLQRASDDLVGLLLEISELRRLIGPRRLHALETAKRVASLRLSGVPVPAICVRTGLSRSRVYQLLDNPVVESAP